MKKITVSILLKLLIFIACDRQNPRDYNELIGEARNLYAVGDYEESGEKFSDAFEATKDILFKRPGKYIQAETTPHYVMLNLFQHPF